MGLLTLYQQLLALFWLDYIRSKNVKSRFAFKSACTFLLDLTQVICSVLFSFPKRNIINLPSGSSILIFLMFTQNNTLCIAVSVICLSKAYLLNLIWQTKIVFYFNNAVMIIHLNIIFLFLYSIIHVKIIKQYYFINNYCLLFLKDK